MQIYTELVLDLVCLALEPSSDFMFFRGFWVYLLCADGSVSITGWSASSDLVSGEACCQHGVLGTFIKQKLQMSSFVVC